VVGKHLSLPPPFGFSTRMRRSAPSAVSSPITGCETIGNGWSLALIGNASAKKEALALGAEDVGRLYGGRLHGLFLRLKARRRDLDYEFLRGLVAQWREVADNYYGDYYPLTPYRTENDVWMAWQFDRPESGGGMVQVFRRPKSSIAAMNFKLRGLDPVARCSVTNLDAPDPTAMTGRELMEKGLLVTLREQPDSALIFYKRVK